jgi:ubiquinone/menaquinone biosynthesis C-methylase UbiE
MRKFRRFYYDVFSRHYDEFVAMHSSDSQQELRELLSTTIPARTNDSILDLCTGTGSLLPYLQKRVGAKGRVVRVDFSMNMLKMSKEKIKTFENIFVIQADVEALPFIENNFDAVTCSHAFYELKGRSQDRSLKEAIRVLKPGKSFLLMEHDIPKNSFIRLLFYIRLLSMGLKNAITILKHEKEVLGEYFSDIQKITTPSGRSKILICRN